MIITFVLCCVVLIPCDELHSTGTVFDNRDLVGIALCSHGCVVDPHFFPVISGVVAC